MSKKDLWVGSLVLFIGISIIISSYIIGNSIKSVSRQDPSTASAGIKILDLPQVAKYLNMSEEEIRGIIQMEKNKLEKTGSFYGKMFPYFSINNKQYFYIDEIDEWLKDVSSNRREYNIKEGWILQ